MELKNKEKRENIFYLLRCARRKMNGTGVKVYLIYSSRAYLKGSKSDRVEKSYFSLQLEMSLFACLRTTMVIN